MAMIQVVSEALSRPVNRKQFLKQVGVLALALVGVTSLIRALEKTGNQRPSDGYGKSPYGG